MRYEYGTRHTSNTIFINAVYCTGVDICQAESLCVQFSTAQSLAVAVPHSSLRVAAYQPPVLRTRCRGLPATSSSIAHGGIILLLEFRRVHGPVLKLPCRNMHRRKMMALAQWICAAVWEIHATHAQTPADVSHGAAGSGVCDSGWVALANGSCEQCSPGRGATNAIHTTTAEVNPDRSSGAEEEVLTSLVCE